MRADALPPLARFFRRLVAARVPILLFYLVLAPIGVALALRVPSEGAIDRLVVTGDPDHVLTTAFQRIFPEGERVLLLAESDDPFAPEALAELGRLEERVRAVPHVGVFSALTLYRRVEPGFDGGPEAAARFRRFVTGTDLLARQGLVAKDFLAIALEIDAPGPEDRDAALAGVEAVLTPFDRPGNAFRAVRRVGAPYVESWLEGETRGATARYFPLFGLFVVVLNIALYRSWRALAAFLLTLAATVSISVGLADLAGWSFTIVSSLVPLTVLITTTATLVYLHSRYVEQPDDLPIDDHQALALANKFLPCTASVFAAAVGFAALTVSSIRPVYEMGIWTASGLAVSWVACFTLFPALQRTLRTPTHRERATAVRWFPALVDVLIPFSYRWRWMLVAASALVMAVGCAALFGVPGLIPPMPLETDALDYVDRDLPVYRDTRKFESAVTGLDVTEVWVRTAPGGVLEPGLLRGLELFARELEADPRVGSVAGPTTLLRWVRYAAGGGDRLPEEASAWPKLAGDLEQLLLAEPAVRGFVDVGTLENARLTVVGRTGGFGGSGGIREFLESRWRAAARLEPALAAARMDVVGQGLLQAKIAEHLVPTLTESFALTAGIIFVAFLILFRSGPARIMAMVPSVFAILAMFVVMRLTGIPLNVATILIASTVLGASENDQIHFFYHFQERRKDASAEAALRHAMLVAGRAILFATLINAGGFLALAFSDLPPMRQFGIVSASAFVLAMIADFTALPAALWIVFRAKPDERR